MRNFLIIGRTIYEIHIEEYSMIQPPSSYKILVIGFFIVSILISGCGGSSGLTSNSSSSFSVSGVVSDGAIEDAIVWLDLNGDGLIGADEPSTKSDAEGNFNIETIRSLTREVMIKAMGGIDTGTNLPFEGILEAKSSTETNSLTQMLTPLTTLKSKGLEEVDIRKMFPNLPEGDIDKMNPNIHKEFERIGMVVHSTIAQLTKATKTSLSTDTLDDLYKTFADEIKDLVNQDKELKFETLPLDKMIQDSQAAIEAEKASAIQAMIKDTTKQMLELNLDKIENDQRLREFQIFAMRDVHSKIDQLKSDQLDKTKFLEESKQIREKMIQELVQFSVNGVISNGALSGAEVWLDFNENGIIDADEPSTISDADGNFSLETLQKRIEPVVIRAMGGIDTDTNLSFEGILEAVSAVDSKNLTQMLTPLTTLKNKAALTDEDIRNMFPNLLLEGDIDTMNPKTHKEIERVGMVIHSTINQLTNAAKSAGSTESMNDIYKSFADEIKALKQRDQEINFENLPLDKILNESQNAIEAGKVDTIKSMIMDTTQQMLGLDLSAIDNDERLKGYQLFSMTDMQSSMDRFIKNELNEAAFLADSKRIRDEMIAKQVQDAMAQRSEQIDAIRKKMTDDIKSELNLDGHLQDTETMHPIEATITKNVIEQVEQSIIQDVQSQINDDFIHSHSVKGIVSEDEINRFKQNTMQDMLSRFGNFFNRR